MDCQWPGHGAKPTKTQTKGNTDSMKSKLTILAALAATGTLVQAGVVQWTVASGGNGHWYEAVPVTEALAWPDANAAAQAKGGYLVDILSAEENAFVFGLIDDPAYWIEAFFDTDIPFVDGPWIGAHQTDFSNEPGGNFIWSSDGSPVGYTSWHPGNPDNFGANEHHVSFFTFGSHDRSSLWNDSDGIHRHAYIVEYDSKPKTPVPDAGGTAALVAIALGGLGMVSRKES